MKIIDAHSHVDYITHHHQTDVVGTVVCTTKESEWNALSNLCNQDTNIYGVFGVHPWFVDSVEDGFELRLEHLLKNNTSYMIGEIGLDKNKPDMDKQIDVFIKQFNVAVRLHRTMFVHCVGVWDKILHILKQYKKSELPTIVFHAFKASNDILQNLLSCYDNVMFSFNKNVVYSRNSRIEQIPINRILVESDGKTDIELKYIIERIVELKHDVDIDNFIYDNTLKVLYNE